MFENALRKLEQGAWLSGRCRGQLPVLWHQQWLQGTARGMHAKQCLVQLQQVVQARGRRQGHAA